jgi:hypothetical protein
LHPAKILVLNWRKSLFKLLVFELVVKSPKLLKFSVITRTQLSVFSEVPFHMQARGRSLWSVKIPDSGMLLVQGNLIFGCL